MNISADVLKEINDAATSAAERLQLETVSEGASEENIVLALQAARALTMGIHPDSDLIFCVVAALIEKTQTS